jgi:UDP:flavonoid glycosyltransferase YjiC (YdhE family)
MRITIPALGSRGDVQPLIALGLGLQGSGYDVRMATHDVFESMVRDLGLEFFLIPVNPVEVMESDEGKAAMEQGGNPIKSMRAFTKMMYPHMLKCGRACWEACQGTDAMLSSTFGSYFTPHINAKLDVPAIGAFLQPAWITGSFGPQLVSPWKRRSRFRNRLLWRIHDAMYWFPQKAWINDWRTNDLGLPRLPRLQFGSGQWKDGTALSLFGFSPSVLPKPPDWGDNVHVTGYWFLDLQTNWKPPRDLEAFLNAGPPPIYVGFGSMSTRSSGEATKIILDALAGTGRRGLLAKGWGGVAKGDLPENVFIIESAPHDWLFPRMAAVVHHCGAGTAAAGLRAGIPTIPVPYFADQPYWGKWLFDLGVAARPIPQAELSVDRLAAAINTVTGDKEIKSSAAALAQKIRSEDGIGTAVELIDNHIESRKRRTRDGS